MLVHDDRAMEKFRSKHGIPANVIIEHLKLNDIPRVVANLLGWTSIPNQPATKRGDGALSSHLHASLYQLCLYCARDRYVDVDITQALQRGGPITCIHCGSTEEGAGQPSIWG